MPNLLIKLLIGIPGTMILYFAAILAIVSLTAPESNGFWGISAFGAGLFIAAIGSIFIALPCGVIISIIPLGKAPRALSIVAYGVSAALTVNLIVIVLSRVSEDGTSSSSIVMPLVISTIGSTISNVLVLLLFKFMSQRSDSTAKLP
jgi:hypothetical protein